MPKVDIECVTHHICACQEAELRRLRAVEQAARLFRKWGTNVKRHALEDELDRLDGIEPQPRPRGDFHEARGALAAARKQEVGDA